jgi:glucose/mannose transport system substrate-binding protein
MYMKLYRDKDVNLPATPQFKQMLASFKKLHNYVDAGSPNRNWNDATAMVISGKAGVQIMGDWAKGEFATAHLTAGKEFGCFPGFGARSPYLVAGDVFVFPKITDAAQVKSQQLLATVFTSPATQVAFSNKKGSIPIRTDVDIKSLDLCAQQGVTIMKDVSRQLPTPEMLISPDLEGSLQDVITKFWNTGESVDDAAKAIAAALKNG